MNEMFTLLLYALILPSLLLLSAESITIKYKKETLQNLAQNFTM